MRMAPCLTNKTVLLSIGAILILLTTFQCYYSEYNYLAMIVRPKWRECMNQHLKNYSAKEWDIFSQVVALCSNKSSVHKPQAFTNKDETKYAYLTDPKRESILITIGVGKDTVAEVKFRENQPRTKFYGADPITEFNEDLYSKFGQFYPFAIGNETKKSTASVLVDGKYINKSFFHLNMVVFLKYLVQQRYIDHLWFDAEGAEFGIFDMFHKHGDFDKNLIVVCQVNNETHLSRPADKGTFMSFVEKLVNEGRYIVVESLTAVHNRLFFVNVESKYCREKFNFEKFKRF